MRINLVAEEQKRRGRRKRRRRSRTFEETITMPQTQRKRRSSKRRRRSRTFEEAVTLPQVQRKRRSSSRRPPTRRSRAAAVQPAGQPEATARRSVLRRIRWRTVLARFPLLLILATLVGGIVYGSVDTRFFVYGAQIVGARHLEDKTIYEVSGVHEQNIFWVQPKEVARRIGELDGMAGRE